MEAFSFKWFSLMLLTSHRTSMVEGHTDCQPWQYSVQWK